MEVAGLVVDEAPRGLAVLGRVALGRLRRQRGAVLPELHRGPRRTIEGPGPPPALRRPRSATLGRHGGIARRAPSRRPAGLAGGMGRGDAQGEVSFSFRLVPVGPTPVSRSDPSVLANDPARLLGPPRTALNSQRENWRARSAAADG